MPEKGWESNPSGCHLLGVPERVPPHLGASFWTRVKRPGAEGEDPSKASGPPQIRFRKAVPACGVGARGGPKEVA